MNQIPKDLTEEGRKQWLENYPIPIEDFGKDWVGAFHNLLDYKMDEESVFALRQALNTTRTILLNCTDGTLDILKVTYPWPKWQQVSDDNWRGTVVVVEDDNGEQYEDYHKWVQAVYEVDTNKTAEELDKEWKAHVVKLMDAEGITVNPSWVHTIMNISKVKSKKTHKRILKENGFCTWLEKNYRTRKPNFVTVHPIQL